ncbi:hypothetical protein GGQ84_002476 [Desulfitispora alkaliphila]|uniref:hypothetical protein n=1 Tax=Desulfitispora alkaliphila TaxID=622674 RepID=UPI003D214021
MHLNETEAVYVFILLSLGIVIYEIYREHRKKRRLGKIQYKVVTVNRNFFIVTWILITISLMAGKIALKGSVLFAIPWGIIGLLAIVSIFRDNEIREKGISTSNDIIEWSDIQYYKSIDESTVEIVTNKKTFWRKNKRLRWDVEERKFVELLGILEKHITSQT